MADSGLVVVLCVITLLLVAVFLPLISVQYEWCHVLFENNTVIGLVDIFKSGLEWSHMSYFIYIKFCAKEFFSEISILDDKWLSKIVKKRRKYVFFFNGLELERFLEL